VRHVKVVESAVYTEHSVPSSVRTTEIALLSYPKFVPVIVKVVPPNLLMFSSATTEAIVNSTSI
jgi:hypothetical protein